MGAGHGTDASGRGLRRRHGDGALRRAPARAKLIALVVFAATVVALPREWFWAYGVAFVSLVGLLAWARVPVSFIAKRLLIEIPFLVFALLLPVIATGPRVDVGALSLSVAGLWGAWALLAKATLSVLAGILLVATTEPRQIVIALDQLRLPRALTSIIGFMVRYLDLIVEDARRMRVAREARGFRGRDIRSWPVIAVALGALFIRSHARGERIHLAMLSRGYEG